MGYNARGCRTAALTRLVSWVNSIDVPMFVIHRTGAHPAERLEYVAANPALSRVASLPMDLFLGQTVEEVFPTRTAARLDEKHRACFESDTPVTYEECLLIEGRETWWQTTLSKPDGFDGDVVLGVAVAITERKRREFADAEALADLTTRFDDLRLFSTMAAHDARSPLATVSSLMELVLDGFEDMGDGKTELLRLCSKTVDEALEQITATLERGRSMAPERVTPERVDLGQLCGDIAALVDPEMALNIETPDLVVDCDQVVLQMSLRNLMSNAARYCRERIVVTAQLEAARGLLSLEVADDGPSLPSETTLADLTRQGTDREGAHGFGLASIAKLVQSRGGSFDLIRQDADPVMSGARFRLTLPAHAPSDPKVPAGADRRDSTQAAHA